jgi:hypothetical protein
MLPGATVLYDGGIEIADPFKTIGGICNAFAPVGTLKIRLIPLVEKQLQKLSRRNPEQKNYTKAINRIWF